MSKLKIDKGASRIRRVPLKTTIDGAVWDDVELMCQWSENDTSYVVNQLLRFALSQSEEFQEHKQSAEANRPSAKNGAQSEQRSAVAVTSRLQESGK
jgi:hypothetical protein